MAWAAPTNQAVIRVTERGQRVWQEAAEGWEEVLPDALRVWSSARVLLCEKRATSTSFEKNCGVRAASAVKTVTLYPSLAPLCAEFVSVVARSICSTLSKQLAAGDALTLFRVCLVAVR
jgi:hypothetical protein